ncbi:MAG: hypothetical protein CVT99_02175 [Bacteroidetes bacterium HGW-Bacteroidetes-16]|jgi:hypothetical protein|nr:MAG: hypothetical protein CVT99_02175 [Bacteroidetes bacterium HGW-Bacteroidetes-16]
MREQLKTELRLLIIQIDQFRERFGDNDIRPGFLDEYFEIVKTFFCAYYQIEENDILDKYHEIYGRNDFDKNDILGPLQGQRNILNSFLIINCWSNFELFVTLFCQAFLESKEIEELLDLDYLRVKDTLKNCTIDPKTDEKLKKLKKDHIAHSPINNKFGKLLKKVNPYPKGRSKKYDREFLEFFGKLRNCIHSNYIYYGSHDYEFTYNNETFSFSHGKIVSQSTFTESTIFSLTLFLKEIFLVITDNNKFDKEIYDPSNELIK